jgi:maltooligosyltrehalose trehalohydrolase
MLFMGEEWGARTPWMFFTDHTNPEIGTATAQGRKAEFGSHGWDEDDVPDPQDPETFRRSKLDWSEPDREPHRRVLGWYRDLLALRRAHPDLRDPRLGASEVSWQDRRLRMGRGAFEVLVNLSDESWACDVGDASEVLLTWQDGVVVKDGHLDVPARSAVVLAR